MSGQSGEPTRDLTNPLGTNPAEERQLRAGDVLGGRFVIVQFLASGGMGEVYEAEDRELQGKHLALKTLRPEIAGNAAMRQRFEREVLLAREVSHRNVCPMYDLFRMEGPRGPILFLTMKLLRGESLAARLHRTGKLDSEVAHAIAKQLAEALDAAHRAGVIHRDFKPGNVMIEGSGEEQRVSVTDFGLSRLYESDETLAEPGHVAGTLGYIAPEVLEGRTALPASDVYAFGVVVYEMLTGTRPGGLSDTGSPPRPSKAVEGLPRAWDDVVRGCLARDPARRCQSAGEVLALLDRTARSGTSVARPAVTRRAAIGAGAVTAAAAAGAWFTWPAIDAVLHPLPDRRFVALIAWPGDVDTPLRALLNGILDGIAARLVRAEAFVQHLLIIRPADVPGQPLREPKQAVYLLGANLVLAASLRASEGGFTLALRLLDAAEERVLRQRLLFAPASEASRLPERAAVSAIALLQVKAAPRKSAVLDDLAGVSAAAYDAFASAEEFRRLPNDTGLDSAIAKYQQVLEADPNFALAYARLAMAYIRKFQMRHEPGSLRLAERNADRALQINASSATSLLSRGLAYLYSGQTPEAMALMTQAQRIDLGNPEILLYQAHAFADLDERKEEEAVYRSILKQRPNFWPAYNELGRLLYRQGRLADAAEAFQEASAVAPQVALPLTNAGSMYLMMNRRDDAISAFQQSLRAAPNELAYLNLGNLSFEDRDYRKALDYYDKARDANPRSHETFRNIGDCYDVLGNRSRMVESYSRAAELLAGQLQANPRRGSDWMTLAFYEAKAGRRERAEADIRAAEERGATDVPSQFLKAQTAAVLGRKEEALRLVLACLDRGLSTIEVEFALDLKAVRADPRYRERVVKGGKHG
ncbi:MAG: protein kinase [Acidobacteriia bacterium]|nr:protein kinase [Terriglobia bacterium]